MLRITRQESVCVCGGEGGCGGGSRSSYKSSPSLLPLESPESLLHLSPPWRISKGLCVGVILWWEGAGGVGAIQFFSLIWYHVLVL